MMTLGNDQSLSWVILSASNDRLFNPAKRRRSRSWASISAKACASEGGSGCSTIIRCRDLSFFPCMASIPLCVIVEAKREAPGMVAEKQRRNFASLDRRLIRGKFRGENAFCCAVALALRQAGKPF